jgi:hypothetical protein
MLLLVFEVDTGFKHELLIDASSVTVTGVVAITANRASGTNKVKLALCRNMGCSYVLCHILELGATQVVSL